MSTARWRNVATMSESGQRRGAIPSAARPLFMLTADTSLRSWYRSFVP